MRHPRLVGVAGACLLSGALAVLAQPALRMQERAAVQNQLQLAAHLRENVVLQQQMLAAAERLPRGPQFDDHMLSLEQGLADARFMLFNATGEGGAELVQIQQRIVLRLEGMVQQRRMVIDPARVSDHRLAQLSNELAAARLALFELTSQ